MKVSDLGNEPIGMRESLIYAIASAAIVLASAPMASNPWIGAFDFFGCLFSGLMWLRYLMTTDWKPIPAELKAVVMRGWLYLSGHQELME